MCPVTFRSSAPRRASSGRTFPESKDWYHEEQQRVRAAGRGNHRRLGIIFSSVNSRAAGCGGLTLDHRKVGQNLPEGHAVADKKVTSLCNRRLGSNLQFVEILPEPGADLLPDGIRHACNSALTFAFED